MMPEQFAGLQAVLQAAAVDLAAAALAGQRPHRAMHFIDLDAAGLLVQAVDVLRRNLDAFSAAFRQFCQRQVAGIRLSLLNRDVQWPDDTIKITRV